jgi:hypothetical protein
MIEEEPLDVQVQRVVFGSEDIRMLPVFTSPADGSKHVASELAASFVKSAWCYLPKYDHDEKGDEFCEPIPPYSTDIADAWKIVEMMRENEWTVDCGLMDTRKTRMAIWRFRKYNPASNGGYPHFFEGECTVPLGKDSKAICVAAIVAIEKEKS